jgi:hypothetical protein
LINFIRKCQRVQSPHPLQLRQDDEKKHKGLLQLTKVVNHQKR